jgi:hypothetical protein
MTMHWPEITSDLYQAALSAVRWEEEPPQGAELHVSWFGGDGFHVVDVWQSQEDFERFVAERLDPVVREKLGVTSNPVVEYSPLNRRFVAPGVTGASG